jgi:hypothetical protein
MYKRLFLERTKERYKQIISDTLIISKKFVEKFPDITMYESIHNQILDIKKEIVEKEIVFTEDEIYSRYNLGAIAAKNFDLEHDEFAQRLSDIFGGSMDYNTMIER